MKKYLRLMIFVVLVSFGIGTEGARAGDREYKEGHDESSVGRPVSSRGSFSGRIDGKQISGGGSSGFGGEDPDRVPL